MTLDNQTQTLLDQMASSGNPPLHMQDVAAARDGLKTLTLAMDVAPEVIGRSEAREIPGQEVPIPVRIYWPETDPEGSLPIVLHFHGGGFALGDLDTHENVSRFYCHHARAIVIAVHYRLAPEHKFPAGVEDCYSTLCWAAENASVLGGNLERIAVIGDSAGGNLSAVTCQLSMRRQGPDIACQALVYPVVDMGSSNTFTSRELFGTGDYFLSNQDISWISDLYFNRPESEANDLCASPYLAKSLEGLPPALVITAGYDPLRDEGQAYGERLVAAGVSVQQKCFGGTIHGFMSFAGGIDAGREGLATAANFLREQLHP